MSTAEAGRKPDGRVDLTACARIAATARASVTADALGVAWREEVDPFFRSWPNLIQRWRFRRRYRWRRLERSRLRMDIEPGRVPDCPSCNAACCRGPNLVSLRLADVARLADLGLGWAAVAPRPAERAGVYRHHPELAALERLDSFSLFPVLAQVDDHCVFLGSDERCSIHPVRPLACRRYPYLVSQDLLAVRWAQGCPRWQTDAGEAAQAQLVSEVIEHFDHKLRDLALLRFGREALVRLGLWDRLPAAQRRREFAATLGASTRLD